MKQNDKFRLSNSDDRTLISVHISKITKQRVIHKCPFLVTLNKYFGGPHTRELP